MALNRTRRVGLFSIFLALGVLAGLYNSAFRNLTAARQARRNDDCASAEKYLNLCWPVPGLRGARALEEELLGVQQGDLTTEKAWQARPKGQSPDGVPILEALAKGSLATFRFNECRQYADEILERQPGHAQALWLRGRAWVRLQQEERARDDFEQALNREPDAHEI